jgi:hypothetical protein
MFYRYTLYRIALGCHHLRGRICRRTPPSANGTPCQFGGHIADETTDISRETSSVSSPAAVGQPAAGQPPRLRSHGGPGELQRRANQPVGPQRRLLLLRFGLRDQRGRVLAGLLGLSLAAVG